MINYNLAKERGLSKDNLKDLLLYHECMTSLVYKNAYDNAYGSLSKRAQKTLRKQVRRLEYKMQDCWGFERNKERHTHWKRFPSLEPKPMN